jgi:hypothetical protein
MNVIYSSMRLYGIMEERIFEEKRIKKSNTRRLTLRKIMFFSSLAATLLVFSIPHTTVAYYPGAVIDSSAAVIVPTIDGTFSPTPDEWSDATSVTLTDSEHGTTVYGYLKNNANLFYILIDVPPLEAGGHGQETFLDMDFDIEPINSYTAGARALCTVYGAEKGDAEYKVNSDVDGDGDIDIYDVVIACTHYGEEYP